MAHDADVIVVGAGLAGLVAASELVDAGRKVLLLDQEPEASLGGQAWWSFGGLFMVDTPEQRRLRVRDSSALALQDWLGSAAFDRPEDEWPKRWAEAYVDFASGEKRAWLHGLGVRFFPLVQWAERGGYLAGGHGNSVPRFHVTWGTGPGIVEPFAKRVRQAEAAGLLEFRFRHRVTGLTTTGGVVDGVSGEVLVPSAVERAEPSSREVAGSFELRAQAVVVTSGGIGGNHELVRRNWPARMGTPPEHMLSGVPDHVDGLMLQVVNEAGGRIINEDRMWHYPEGIDNHSPVWSRHGIRILPGPSPLWLDATGKRLPIPLFPGFDALGALEHIVKTGHGHSWFLLNQRIIGKEFALSGSEQNPDLTGRDVKMLLKRVLPGAVTPVEVFAKRSPEFITGRTVAEVVAGMNALVGEDLVDAAELQRVVVERDRQVLSGLGKDMQVNAMREARKFLTDKVMRVVEPHALLDPKAGPLIAVRLSVLTRKTLGGLHTDLSGRVLTQDGSVLEGVYAAGEAAGFGGGGVHGYRALEGTFLGGCLFSGRTAGRAAAKALG
ncbi:FAD-binding dehydrogenase [Actinosynnema pretiosum subsp. pretiosum]|uniref:Fumarate reductase/succinate dehydrogenase flavoprotein domain protein n=2 Tax=Actinosynnema TaxID=40566 RepID=C6WHS0_ACTMD|nr:FAD-binding dehydrogenase [Actinosynnema mirum]ACU40019.1 fumarate reductase/succinate dehydrogenase flavoprotein domain protein [Actinosynnema mirum DSM 43827]AXX33542.1 Fumarate/succinate/L-aspartate dehydrogenase [Actinosynnema pretiosum subsp. pretiosum]QUF02658.1 FAD-binding dehydrogenase [Actinosynnema pretiosum subsp. pretiosum]